MIKRFSLFALLLGVLTLTACGLNAAKNTDSKEKDSAMVDNGSSEDTYVLPDVIKIGFIAPLTGNAAAYGQDMKAGIALYFSENPDLGGKPVEVIYEDGKCNGQDAASAAQKLITVDKVQAIIGGVCSGETLAAAPIAEQNKVVLFSPGSSSPEITLAGDYIFRNYPSDAKVAVTLVEDVAKNHTKIAMLSEQTDYAQGYRGAVKAALANYPDAQLVVDEAYAVDNTDFRTLLAKVKDSGADVLLSIAQSPVTNGFAVKQLKELGLDIQVYGTDTIDGADFFETAKDATEGVKQVVVSEDPSRNGYADFVSKVPTPQSSPIFGALAYDAASVLARAIGTVGYDGTAIAGYLNDMPTYKGIGSDIVFDENGDNDVSASVKIAQGGKFVLLTQ